MVGVVAIHPTELLTVSVRVFDPVTDTCAAEELEETCEVGTSGEVCLLTHLLGDPVARIRRSPAYLMLIAETCGVERAMVGLVRGCIRTVTCGTDQINCTVAVYTKLAYILGLRVSTSHRRMGIGLKLVQKLEQWFNSMGADYAYMATDKDNEASIRLFTRRCGYTKFRSASILVQPVFAHCLPGSQRYVILQLFHSDAELIYRERLSTVEFFPQDIDVVLSNYLSLGTFLAVPPGYDYCGAEKFLASPPPSWAVLSVWNCKEVYRLEVRGVARLLRGLAAASRAIDKTMPWLRLPSVPNLFRPFGFYFIYGIGGEGDEAADMLRQLCRQAHNLAREGGCEVVAAEVAACEPLKSGIPHSRRLSCDDLWCIKSLHTDYSDSQFGDWAKAPPGTSIFVDPREVLLWCWIFLWNALEDSLTLAGREF